MHRTANTEKAAFSEKQSSHLVRLQATALMRLLFFSVELSRAALSIHLLCVSVCVCVSVRCQCECECECECE